MLHILAYLAALTPVVSDTPPTVRVPAPQITELRSETEVISHTRFANGAAAPATLILPKINNVVDILKHIRARYSSNYRSRSEAIAWVFVEESGGAHLEKLIVSTGDALADSVAVEALGLAKFEAAKIGNIPVSVWVPIPLGKGMPRPYLANYPNAIKPQLLNRDVISRKLVRAYPQHLRQRGVSGEVLLWVLVDERGGTDRIEVKRSSGIDELDTAAVSVADAMQFTPARIEDFTMPVWIQIPIVFKSM